jgi:hypothetical protein
MSIILLMSGLTATGILAARVRSHRRRERDRVHAYWIARNDAIQRGNRRAA